MSDRITIANVRQAEERLNRSLAYLGSPVRVRVEGRYGHLGIDLYRDDACLRTISTGHTRKDAYQYLGAMNESLTLLDYNDA